MSKKIAQIIILILLIAGFSILAGAYYKKVQIHNNQEVRDGAEPVEPLLRNPELETHLSSVGPELAFGKPFTFTIDADGIGTEVTFPDGLTVRLEKIDDSRCPTDVQCIWAGELTVIFEVSTDDQKTWQEIRLGTTTGMSATLDGYVVTLTQAQTDTATVVINKT